MTKKHVLLSSASAFAMAMLVAPTFAQSDGTDMDSMETVVVTGLRASLQSAQTIKQNSEQVVDSITAVDIGALPDRNVAEALQRVPGVTLQRNDAPNDLTRMGSTGNSVFVRGLSWVKTLVNGRDEFTANNGRSLSFADVSADLMSAVNVYKSPTAKMIEGGVGGVVDLITRKPFDQDGQKFAVSGDVTYGDLVDRALPSVNALYSNRWNFAIGEVGFLASIDWQDQITRTSGINLSEYDCWDVAGDANYGYNDDGYSTCMENDIGTDSRLMGPAGWAWRQMEFKQQRLATNAVIQWRPNDRLEITLSGLNTYAHITDVEHYVYMSIDTEQMAAGTFDSSGNWLGSSSDLSSIDIRGGTGHNRNSDIDLNIKWNPTDALEITADFQFVESSSPRRDVTMYTAMVTKPSVNINLTHKNSPKITWQDNYTCGTSGTEACTTTASNYYWNAAMDHLQYNVAHAGNARIDASYTFPGNGWMNLIKSVDAGFRTEQKLSVSRATGYNWGYICPQGVTWTSTWDGCPTLDGSVATSYTAYDGSTVSSGSTAISTLNNYAELYSYQKVLGNSLPSLWLPSTALASMSTIASNNLFYAIEPQQAYDDYGRNGWAAWDSYASIAGCSGSDMTCLAAYSNLSGTNSSGNRISTQKEQTYAGYLQFNYMHDTFLGYDIPVDGNIGVRIVRTEDNVGDGMLVMPSLSKTYCTVGESIGTDTVESCDDWNTSVAFLGGTDGAGATVERPGVKHGYTSVLPAFNFTAHLSDQLQARLAYSETIVRPSFSYTNSSATLSFNFYDSSTYRYGEWESDPSGYGGNPNLKPMHATNYDASLEWYFSNTGSVTLSVFHKDLSNYVYTATTTQAFTHPESGETMNFDYTTYVNGDKGKVEGFEFAYTQFFDQLPGFWGGFGIQANYTKIYNSGGHNGAVDTSSSTAIANANNTDLPLEGMSDDSYNLTLMYAKYGIDFRLAWNWRSEYLSSSSDSNAKLPAWIENYGQLDGSIFYSFLDHYKVGLQVTNITGAVFYTDLGYKDYHPRTNWIESDRKFALVVRTNW